jgi:hypothetical protein
MFTHIRAASLTLQGVLQRSFVADPDLKALFGGSAIVSLATPDGMEAAGEIGLSMWLYRLIRDEQTLNRQRRRIAPNQIRRQSLPVRLHYLMTPIITGASNIPAPEAEQLIIGRIDPRQRNAHRYTELPPCASAVCDVPPLPSPPIP